MRRLRCEPARIAFKRVTRVSHCQSHRAESRGGVKANEPAVCFPVNCPLCARELLTELSAAEVEEALTVGSAIRLRAACHDVYRDASKLEVEQIREYLGATRLAGYRRGA